MEFIKQDPFLSKFNIRAAYHHIDIYELHADFLVLSWVFGINIKQVYSFAFRIELGFLYFTKISRPLIKKWRGEPNVLLCLDDALG